MHPISLRITLLCLLVSEAISAQVVPGNQLLSLGYGWAPSIQLFEGNHIGILEPTEKENENKSTTGIFFGNYRYFVSRRFAAGFTLGAESESGDWYYVYMSGHSSDWGSSQVGTFSRMTVTFAPEFTFSYSDNSGDGCLYTTFGVGVSFVKETDVQTMQPNFYNNYGEHRGPGDYTFSKLNAYYSPLGYRFDISKQVKGYFELGIGYKGLVNAGLCYRLFTEVNSSKRHDPEIVSKPVILLPKQFQLEPKLQYMGTVMTGRHKHQRLSFSERVTLVSDKTHQASANVFRISKISHFAGHIQPGNIKGEAWYTPNYDSFQIYAENKKKNVYRNNTVSYLVVYCPIVGNVRDKVDRIKYSINNNEQPDMRPGEVYKYELTREGKYSVTTKQDTVTVNMQPGNTYYIRCWKSTRRSTNVIRENDTRGELESSLGKVLYTGDIKRVQKSRQPDED